MLNLKSSHVRGQKPFSKLTLIEACHGRVLGVKSGNERSVLGFLELFSAKSQLSLLAGSLECWRLHAALLDFIIKWQTNRIMSIRTMVALMLVAPDSRSCDIDARSKYMVQKSSRLARIDAARKANEVCMSVLSSIPINGFNCKVQTGEISHVHVVLRSYIANISEAEDLLCIKKRYQTFFSSHMCLVQKENLSTWPRWKAKKRRPYNKTFVIHIT